MFCYDQANITYAVTFGKGDGSSDIDYCVDLNKKEARIYTKARMLGEDLNDVLEAYRIEREIIRYERNEYGSDIRDAKVSIYFCNNQEQPPLDDIKAYITDLLKARKYELVYDVIVAQINFFEDTKNDWKQISLDLAEELHCAGYIKKYKDKKIEKKPKETIPEYISDKLQDAIDNFNSYYKNILNILKDYDDYNGIYVYSEGFYYIVTKVIDNKEYKGVLGHTGELLLPCKYTFLWETLTIFYRHTKDEWDFNHHLKFMSTYSKYDFPIFAFKEDNDGPLGIIKIDGTVILKPRFKYLGYYSHENDYKHKLIVAGDNEKSKGVFSLELNNFITPCKYENIWFARDKHIMCDYNINPDEPWKRDKDFYDFKGKLIKQEKVKKDK